SEPLLPLRDVDGAFGSQPVVQGVSLSIAGGEMLGLVGESGSGKSVTALSILRLVPEPPGRITGGEILFAGGDVLTLDRRSLRRLRGGEIGMIFQEPMTSLNPVFTVGDQIAEAIRLHERVTERAAAGRAAELLALVGLPAPAAMLERYPHELSGGQRQRVMIAIALACRPKLLIADEPTTALDVTVQAQILELIARLRRELGMAVLLITHDLGVVGQYCDRVAVMYAGRIVEEAPVAELFARPRHRYTEALMLTRPAANPPGRVLPTIPGMVPAPGDLPAGCAFNPRCGFAIDRCRAERPALVEADPGHRAACWNPATDSPA
ncbi:ABC transporter ATP-binding protein, partial [Mycobacterium tuberculosis]|nr:ABC transporter ATP-binding protein [Mycobacterium tuberculosis]